MAHGSLDVCSMTIPKCVVVIVICSVLTRSWNTCQGTVHVQSCLLRAARRVCTRDTLFPSVRSSNEPSRPRAHVCTPTLAFCVCDFCGLSEYFGSSSLWFVIC